MGLLPTVWDLVWHMKLASGGYTSFELKDAEGMRWGWAVNATAIGWTAHIGDWGQAETIGRVPTIPDKDQVLKSFQYLSEAKDWIEQEVANFWKEDR